MPSEQSIVHRLNGIIVPARGPELDIGKWKKIPPKLNHIKKKIFWYIILFIRVNLNLIKNFLLEKHMGKKSNISARCMCMGHVVTLPDLKSWLQHLLSGLMGRYSLLRASGSSSAKWAVEYWKQPPRLILKIKWDDTCKTIH